MVKCKKCGGKLGFWSGNTELGLCGRCLEEHNKEAERKAPELEKFASEIATLGQRVGQFLPRGSSQWIEVREIGERINSKYGLDGMLAVYELVRNKCGGRDGSLDIAWDDIGGWMK